MATLGRSGDALPGAADTGIAMTWTSQSPTSEEKMRSEPVASEMSTSMRARARSSLFSAIRRMPFPG
jgi:hypothetical protein